MSIIIFPSACLPPVSYFTKLCNSNEIYIDGYDFFRKQTLRNRFTIITANGPLNLTVPVQHPVQHKALKDVRISYQNDWISKHHNAIKSAYGRASYYEYLNDELFRIFETKHSFLIDLNNELLFWILKILKSKTQITFTEQYLEKSNELYDLRLSDFNSNSTPYIQVFDTRFGFLPGASIIDLIFNCGPSSSSHLNF